MPIRRKVFRVEEMQLGGKRPSASESTSAVETAPTPMQQKIFAELMALRALIERRPDHASGTNTDRLGADDLEAKGLRQLKDETDTIQRAINRTKQEIATLHVNGLNAPENGRVVRELDAVVGGTEEAIQTILAAAEDIDEAANTLSAILKREQDQALAQDIREHVIRIFEACNFHDLAGQRISKVLATLKFVEERIARMMAIWGGVDAFKDYTAAAASEGDKATVFISGPKLDGDPGHASQDDIDLLFG